MQNLRTPASARGDMVACSDCPIRHQAVCARCEAEDLEALEAAKFFRRFAPGQAVVSAGDRMDFVASVMTGAATLTHLREDGRTQIVGLLLPSDFLGRPGRDRAAYDVAALEETVLCCFRRSAFEAILDRNPRIRQRLLEMALDELEASRNWLTLLGRKTAREKIASFFVMLAERAGRLQGGAAVASVTLPVTREQMADQLDLTMETVSRQLTALRSDGLLVPQGPRVFDLPDPGALQAAAGV
jgi:CRP/FNR family transcriptional regulator, anaerobic regulatory protein